MTEHIMKHVYSEQSIEDNNALMAKNNLERGQLAELLNRLTLKWKMATTAYVQFDI